MLTESSVQPFDSARVAHAIISTMMSMTIKGLMLDLDGTLYVGREPVAGAREAVEALGLQALRSGTSRTRPGCLAAWWSRGCGRSGSWLRRMRSSHRRGRPPV